LSSRAITAGQNAGIIAEPASDSSAKGRLEIQRFSLVDPVPERSSPTQFPGAAVGNIPVIMLATGTKWRVQHPRPPSTRDPGPDGTGHNLHDNTITFQRRSDAKASPANITGNNTVTANTSPAPPSGLFVNNAEDQPAMPLPPRPLPPR
jgi:hypothetical protein